MNNLLINDNICGHCKHYDCRSMWDNYFYGGCRLCGLETSYSNSCPHFVEAPRIRREREFQQSLRRKQ